MHHSPITLTKVAAKEQCATKNLASFCNYHTDLQPVAIDFRSHTPVRKKRETGSQNAIESSDFRLFQLNHQDNASLLFIQFVKAVSNFLLSFVFMSLDNENTNKQSHLSDTRFTSLNLDPKLAQGIEACGFEFCTPIQADTLPLALKGNIFFGERSFS